MPLSKLEDAQCLVRVAAGDSAAFGEILRRYQDRIVNLVYRMVSDWDLALDLCQEAFLKVYRRAETFDPAGNPRAWLYTIAVNAARDHLRRRPRIVFLDRIEGLAGDGATPRRRSAATPPEILQQAE